MDLMKIGVISDTHGLLRPAALAALSGSDLIIHAGDVGSPAILEALRAIAPVVAVRGNVDREPWGRALPETEVVQAGGLYLYILHDLKQLDIDPVGGGFSVIISGHSHRGVIEQRHGVLYLNPGSAGPPRFHLPATVAHLRVEGSLLRAELVPLAT